MSTKQTVEQELLAITDQKPKGKKEDMGEYFGRIATAVAEIEDDQYKALSAGAKAWFKQAADAMKEEPPATENIKPFGGYDKLNEVKEEEEAEEEEEEEAPTPKAKGGGKKGMPKKEEAEEETASTKSKPKEETKGAKIRQSSVADTIRHIMCDNPAVTKDQVGKELKARKLSFDVSRLDQVFSATARVLEILQEKKKLK